MFKFVAIAFFICLSSRAETYSWNLQITPEKYVLKIQMTFRNLIHLPEVSRAFKNPRLLANVSDAIQDVIYEPDMARRYRQFVNVKSWGVSSTLISDCQEEYEFSRWKRTCQLLTGEGDGGRYMVWKGDDLTCEQRTTHVECVAEIQGLSKPLVVLGIQLATPQVFSLKAKIPALYNFAQIWWAIDQSNWDSNRIKSDFEDSTLKKEIDRMLDQGLTILDSKDSFQFSGGSTKPQG